MKDTGEFMGHSLVRMPEYKNRDGEFSISVFPKFLRQGYGTEAAMFTVGYAFRALGLQRLSLFVLDGNTATRRLYKDRFSGG
ncbi:hypothetical protein OG21DRAFT_1513109 [Imleria badia]|nr:hypothetical protein OG21DRAFT_1513109 [Imleria badia]